jgi:hypothetical protein
MVVLVIILLYFLKKSIFSLEISKKIFILTIY